MKKIFAIIISFILTGANGQDGLIGYWSFDDLQEDRFDDHSGEGNHGNTKGAHTIKGIKGNALYFDGIDDYAILGDQNNYPPANLKNLGVGSISFWFKVDYIPPEDGIAPIFYYGGIEKCDFFDAANQGLIVEVGHSPIHYGSERLYFTIWANGCTYPSFCFDSNFAIEEGKWNHIVIVVGENYNTGFLNGEEMTHRRYNFGNSTYSQFFEDAVKHEILWLGKGHWDGTEQYFQGAIDELKIFNRTLSKNDISNIYKDTSGFVNSYFQQHINKNPFTIYPNPASNRIQYTIHTEISKPASLELLNSAGKSVLRITEVPQAGIINIQSLKTGIYTLILSHRYDKWFEKVLVVNKDG